MKTKIFSKGQGWYISATNYKDETDKAYINLYFPQGNDFTGEPEFIPNDRGYSALDIDILEARFTSYKGKAGMTIFKYDLLTEAKMDAKSSYSIREVPTEIQTIEEDDLPFY